MASNFFRFLSVFMIFLGGIQEGLLVPPPAGNNIEHLNKMFDIDVLLNRLDQLEAKNEQHEAKEAELEAKVAEHEAVVGPVSQHELKINSQQEEIYQLKKENSKLRDKLPISQKTSSKKVASRKPSSCLDLLDLGHTLSGFYDVLPVGSNQSASIYCDFALEPTEADFETKVGFVDVKSSPVHFFVTRTSSWSTVGTMPFEKEYLNLGGGMNLASGVFTAPKAGIYAFSFKGIGYETSSIYGYAGDGDVFLKRNDEYVARGLSRIYGATSYTLSTVSVQGTLKLDKGDTITIFHSDGTMYGIDFVGNDSWTQFSGSLLQEDLVIS